MLTKIAIQYDDLLGLPWGAPEDGGITCAGVVAEALHRCGFILAPGALPLTEVDLCVSIAILKEDPAGALWERLGARVDDARELGDVVLTAAAGISHVLALVDVRHRLFLTAHREGGVRAVSWRYVRGVVGVYRPRAAHSLRTTDG